MGSDETDSFNLRMKVIIDFPLEMLVKESHPIPGTDSFEGIGALMEDIGRIRSMGVPKDVKKYVDRFMEDSKVEEIEILIQKERLSKSKEGKRKIDYIVRYNGPEGRTLASLAYTSKDLCNIQE